MDTWTWINIRGEVKRAAARAVAAERGKNWDALGFGDRIAICGSAPVKEALAAWQAEHPEPK